MLRCGEVVINGKYRVLCTLGDGAFGEVFQAQCLASNDRVAIKCEAVGMGGFSLLKREFHLYQWLRKGCGETPSFYPFPAVRLFHQDRAASFLVMDCCSTNLMAIVFQQKLEAGRRGMPAVYLDYEGWCKFARRMIRTLEVVHTAGIVHRDIKPANFVLRDADSGIEDEESLLLLDFGLAQLYTDEDPLELRPVECEDGGTPGKMRGLMGSMNYASVNAHRRKELTRRDDLESLAYVLMFLWKVDDLPWATCAAEEEVLSAKLEVTNAADGLPEALVQFLQYVRLLGLHEAPSYRRMERYFQYQQVALANV